MWLAVPYGVGATTGIDSLSDRIAAGWRMRNCERVTSLRGPLAVRRMAAHWVVLAAAALTMLVAATVGAAFAAFAGQVLPQAVRHDLVVAPGTTLAAAGSFASGDPAQTS